MGDARACRAVPRRSAKRVPGRQVQPGPACGKRRSYVLRRQDSSSWRGGVGHTWEARIKFDCLTAGCWPAFWLGNEDHGEIDIIEWYGNGSWPSATTVHAKSNGGEWKTHNVGLDRAWHTWRCQWDAVGIRFWQDYTDGASPYFDVPASSLPDWPFNEPGYMAFPVLNLAVAGSGGGDPSGGRYPAQMLVDYIRVW